MCRVYVRCGGGYFCLPPCLCYKHLKRISVLKKKRHLISMIQSWKETTEFPNFASAFHTPSHPFLIPFSLFRLSALNELHHFPDGVLNTNRREGGRKMDPAGGRPTAIRKKKKDHPHKIEENRGGRRICLNVQ